MDSRQIKPIEDLEVVIQRKIIAKLRSLGWFVIALAGNEYQSGFSDLFAAHTRAGHRWIEIKRPSYQSFTDAQLRDFPLFSANGSGVWVLTSDDDWEIRKLYKYNNWYTYLQVAKRHTKWREKKKKELKPSRIMLRGPEWFIQQTIKTTLEADGWFVKETTGNIFQFGFPDIVATHKKYGLRLIEVKNPTGYVFTSAQIEKFPQFQAHGIGVWILTNASQLDIIHKPCNWRDYL